MKRDKKNNPTGEVHHRELQEAIDEYKDTYTSSFGPDKNSEEEELNIKLWRSTSEVLRRTKQGRVLDLGSSSNPYAIDTPSVNVNVGTSAEILNIVEELQQKHEKKEAQRDRERDKMIKKHEEEVAHRRLVESQLAQLVQAMTTLVLNFAMPMMTPSQFVPPSAGASSAASHSADVCPEVVVQTQGVPRTQPDPTQKDRNED